MATHSIQTVIAELLSPTGPLIAAFTYTVGIIVALYAIEAVYAHLRDDTAEPATVEAATAKPVILTRKRAILNILINDLTGMDVYRCDGDWDDGYFTPCSFRQDDGKIVFGGLKTDGYGHLMAYRRDMATGNYLLIGRTRYHELWKGIRRRRF